MGHIWAHGESGVIVLEFIFNPEDEQFIDFVEITIILETAGDQTGPFGIGGSPLTIEDDSNDYELRIVYTYLKEE